MTDNPGGWAATEPVIRCYRCGNVAEVHWVYVDMSTVAERRPPIRHYDWGQCVTPGCQEPSGSNDPRQPTPGMLRKRADQQWMERQRDLVEDR